MLHRSRPWQICRRCPLCAPNCWACCRRQRGNWSARSPNPLVVWQLFSKLSRKKRAKRVPQRSRYEHLRDLYQKLSQLVRSNYTMAGNLDQIVEQLSTLSVLEAAELVKKLEEKWGVSAAAPMAMAAMPGAGAAAAEPVEEKTEFDVVIKDPGAKKIDVIKVIRQLTQLGLGEAKTMAETAGGKVLTGVGKDAANEAKKRLEEAGANIVLE